VKKTTMTEYYVVLEFPSPLPHADGTPGTSKCGWLPATDAHEITLAIRAGAQFVGVATTAEEVEEMMGAAMSESFLSWLPQDEEDTWMPTGGGWERGYHTKYRHYYRNDRAVCGSTAAPVWDERLWPGKYCPRCCQIRKREVA